MNLEAMRPWLFWALLVDFVAFTGQTTYVLYEYGMSWIPVVFENAVSTLVMQQKNTGPSSVATLTARLTGSSITGHFGRVAGEDVFWAC